MIDYIIEKLETSDVCILCEGEKRILSFAGGICTVPCWLCEETGECKLPAIRVAFLLKVMKQRAAEGCNCGVSKGLRSDHEGECRATYLRSSKEKS